MQTVSWFSHSHQCTVYFCFLLEKNTLSFTCSACQTTKLLRWSAILDKVVCAVNKGQGCIKHLNPFACGGLPGFLIAKVHSFKVKRLVSPLSLVLLSTGTFGCIYYCYRFLNSVTLLLSLWTYPSGKKDGSI